MRILLGMTWGVAAWSLRAMAGVPGEWGEILARFDSYGLPDVSSAAYVNVVACWEPRVEDLLPNDWETSGNAWMLSEERDATGQPIRARVVVNGSRTFVVACGSGVGAKETGNILLAPPVPPKEVLASGRWQAGNPARDAKKGIEFLKSLKWEGEPYGHYRYPGKLFLLARELWKRGDEASASALLAELAAREEGAEGVAREAMNLVADGEYGNLYEAFRVDCDWEAYRDGIRRLLEKYPEGWCAAPMMRLLLEKVDARIANPHPRPTTADSMGEGDLRQAANMIGIRVWRGGADIYDDQPVLWIAPSGWRNQVPEPMDAEMEIRVRGMEAVPFLLALMEEEDVLTDASRLEVSRAGPYRNRFQPEELDRVWTERTEPMRQLLIHKGFDAMDRPATRGEVARRLLRDLMPEWAVGGIHRWMTKTEFIQAVREFYEKHREATDEEWAVLSLPGRYFSFNKLAVDYLMKVARQKSVPELERFLAEEKWLIADASESDLGWANDNKASLLENYTRIRREAEDLSKPLEIEDVAPSVAQMLEDEHYDRTVLGAKLKTMPLAEVLGIVLDCAARTTNAFHRGALVLLVSQQLDLTQGPGMPATARAAEWNELIGDDRVGYENQGAPLVSDQYLLLNERLFSPSRGNTEPDDQYSWKSVEVSEQAVKRLLRAQGPRGRDWLRARVRQRLAGVPEEELPGFPIGRASEEGVVAGLLGQFEAVADREEAARIVAGLSPSERIALPEMLRREPVLNAWLMAMARQVKGVMIDGDLGEWNRKMAAWEGKEPTADLLEDLRRLAEERSAAGQAFSGKLVRRPDFGGYEVVAESSVPVPEHYERQKVTQRISGYAGLVCGSDVYGAARWRTVPPPGENNWWAVETSGPYERRIFQEAIELFLGDTIPASEEAFVMFQTQGEKQ